LQVVADQAGSKHIGESRKRQRRAAGVAVTTPDRRGHRDAHVWRQARLAVQGSLRPPFVVARVRAPEVSRARAHLSDRGHAGHTVSAPCDGCLASIAAASTRSITLPKASATA